MTMQIGVRNDTHCQSKNLLHLCLSECCTGGGGGHFGARKNWNGRMWCQLLNTTTNSIAFSKAPRRETSDVVGKS